MVLENADYVIDSICRQLRHLDLNPHVPNVLAAILSYIGIAHEILPLLEEPVCQLTSFNNLIHYKAVFGFTHLGGTCVPYGMRCIWLCAHSLPSYILDGLLELKFYTFLMCSHLHNFDTF